MITHVVLLQPKAETTESELAAVFKQIERLPEHIAGIINVATGKNLTHNNDKGYSHGFIIQFANEDFFRAYAPHPAHKPVSDELRRICHSIIDFDL
jgi:hypothetical protein